MHLNKLSHFLSTLSTISIFLLTKNRNLFSITYIIGVETCCIGSSCLNQTSFKAIVDSGSSFTFLPKEVYKTISAEVLFFPFQIEL